jgi:hypothetical protein
MRMPTSPGIGNLGHSGSVTPSTGARQPSYPDRARIDSDVRYLLRAPSSPWIAFDKARATVPNFDAAPVVPPSEPSEPSNVVLTTDIRDPEPAPAIVKSHPPIPVPAPAATSRPIGVLLGGAIGFALLIGGALSATSVRSGADAAPAAAASDPAAKAVAPAADLAPSPGLDLSALPAPPPTSEPAAANPVPKGFGRLFVRGAAKNHRVYFDGKLLLGHGQRSFRVFCGEHTIAIDERDSPRNVEVPCNGRLVVSK